MLPLTLSLPDFGIYFCPLAKPRRSRAPKFLFSDIAAFLFSGIAAPATNGSSGDRAARTARPAPAAGSAISFLAKRRRRDRAVELGGQWQQHPARTESRYCAGGAADSRVSLAAAWH